MVIFQGFRSGNKLNQLNVIILYFPQFLKIFLNYFSDFLETICPRWVKLSFHE
ncbi:ATG13 domain-containing protein [Psidium guajava]|nr:ATG13 domain-containing protein [Psidium guajava]